jgi:hypothetical protein
MAKEQRCGLGAWGGGVCLTAFIQKEFCFGGFMLRKLSLIFVIVEWSCSYVSEFRTRSCTATKYLRLLCSHAEGEHWFGGGQFPCLPPSMQDHFTFWSFQIGCFSCVFFLRVVPWHVFCNFFLSSMFLIECSSYFMWCKWRTAATGPAGPGTTRSSVFPPDVDFHQQDPVNSW